MKERDISNQGKMFIDGASKYTEYYFLIDSIIFSLFIHWLYVRKDDPVDSSFEHQN